MAETFDYVIAGGGTAGCLLAFRLSDNKKNTVCVLEAGPPDNNPYIRIPAGFTKTIHDPALTWQLDTEPSATLNGRSIRLTQGRTLGGSSAINGMCFNRGHAIDYDSWAQLGNRGWSYSDVLPYFKRIETRIGPGDDKFRGRSGPIPVTTFAWQHPLVTALIEGAEQIGIPRNPDYNGNGEEFGGAGRFQHNIKNGWRVSSAHAFLHPARKKNGVSVRTDARASRILVENNRAVGVEYISYDRSGNSEPVTVMARKGVIVSSGVVNSPKLLQLSGIGPAELLREKGIKVVHALPGVGENFRDHFGGRLKTRLKNTDSINMRVKGIRLAGEILKWAIGQPSVVALGPAIVHAFGRTKGAELPEYVLLCSPASFKMDLSGLDDFPGMTIGAYSMRPLSEGYVRIASNDPRVPPTFQPNYLDHEYDKRMALAAARDARRLMQTPALKPYFDTELNPGSQIQSDDELLDFIRAMGQSSYHFSGTCKMGPSTDPKAVVDDQLRVHGMDGLYVVDASIMPQPPSSNTMVPTLMIAEKASDMMLRNTK